MNGVTFHVKIRILIIPFDRNNPCFMCGSRVSNPGCLSMYGILYPGAWAFSIYFKDTAMCIYTVYTGVYERIPQDVPNYLIVSSHCH